MQVLAGVGVKILLMILLGYFLKKKGLMDDRFQTQLSTLLVSVVMPINILAAGNSAYSNEMRSGLFVAGAIAVVYYAVSLGGMWLWVRRMSAPEGTKTMFVMTSVFANVGYLGYPLIIELYGNEGYMYAVVYNLFFQLFFFTVGARLMNREEKFDWKSFVLKPSTLAPVVAIAIFVSPFRLPAVLVGTLEQVGGMMVPLSMIIVGGSLVGVKLVSVLQDKWAYLVSALRLIVFPVITLFALYFLGITGVAGKTCVILAGLATATLTVITAEKYKQDVLFATRSVMQSMVLMVVTLPLLLFCMDALYG